MRVQVLPFVDLLILLASGSLVAGGVLKVIHLTSPYTSRLFGMAPIHFALVSTMLLLLAVALIGRSWLMSHEPSQQMAEQRASTTLNAYRAAVQQRDEAPEDVLSVPTASPAPKSS